VAFGLGLSALAAGPAGLPPYSYRGRLWQRSQMRDIGHSPALSTLLRTRTGSASRAGRLSAMSALSASPRRESCPSCCSIALVDVGRRRPCWIPRRSAAADQGTALSGEAPIGVDGRGLRSILGARSGPVPIHRADLSLAPVVRLGCCQTCDSAAAGRARRYWSRAGSLLGRRSARAGGVNSLIRLAASMRLCSSEHEGAR
jgi:hypothetical protein